MYTENERTEDMQVVLMLMEQTLYMLEIFCKIKNTVQRKTRILPGKQALHRLLLSAIMRKNGRRKG